MPVKLNQGGLAPSFLLTSPNTKIVPLPAEEWIAKEIVSGSRIITVTVPFPDKLRLVTDVLNDDLLVPDHSGKSAKAIYKDLDGDFLGFVQQFPANSEVGVLAEKQTKYEINARLTDAYGFLAWMGLKRRKGDDYGIWRFELEFSPFKVGKDRMAALFERLEHALPMLNLVKLISHARVTRLDCAIDLYGLRPAELVVPQKGIQTAQIWEKDGVFQTVNLFAPKPYPVKPPKHGSYRSYGPMVARIYDRSVFSKAYALPEPFEGEPVTRYEVPRIWKGNGPYFDEIISGKNLLEGRGAGFAFPPHLAQRKHWRRIHRSRFPTGKSWVELGKPIGSAILLNQLYDTFPCDLISPENWVDWPLGVKLTGLNKFLG